MARLKWDTMPSPPILEHLKVNGPVYVWGTASLHCISDNIIGHSTDEVNYTVSGNTELHFLLVAM